jgi:hypothetical protein
MACLLELNMLYFFFGNSNFRILYYVDMVHPIWYMFKDKTFAPALLIANVSWTMTWTWSTQPGSIRPECIQAKNLGKDRCRQLGSLTLNRLG